MTRETLRRSLAVLSGGALAGVCCGGNVAVIGVGLGALAVGAVVAIRSGGASAPEATDADGPTADQPPASAPPDSAG